MRCGRCHERLLHVLVNGRNVYLDMVPHSHGTIAAPSDPNKHIAYVLNRDEPPGPGYRRHRRHSCTATDAA